MDAQIQVMKEAQRVQVVEAAAVEVAVEVEMTSQQIALFPLEGTVI